jgi:hypothetical protein
LVKPDGTDLVDIAVINSNYDKIDANIASTKIQATKPATANAGDLWWDSNTGTLYLYYTDANSSQWVAATSDPVNIGVVANQSERDAQYPTPGQGMRVYRTDLGVTQTYYGLFNASTNPGGRDVAGWYNTEKSVGLVPIQPTSVVIATGSGAANSLGVVSFTGATAVSLNNVFSSNYSKYQIIIWDTVASTSTAVPLTYRFRASGTDLTSGYNWARMGYVGTGADSNSGVAQSSANLFNIVNHGTGASLEMTLTNPFSTSAIKNSISVGRGNTTGTGAYVSTAANETATQFDGITFFVSSTLFSGKLQVFGYND